MLSSWKLKGWPRTSEESSCRSSCIGYLIIKRLSNFKKFVVLFVCLFVCRKTDKVLWLAPISRSSSAYRPKSHTTETVNNLKGSTHEILNITIVANMCKDIVD